MNQHRYSNVRLRHKVRWAQVYVRQRRVACGKVLPIHMTVILTSNLKPAVNRQPMSLRRGPEELAESQHAHKKSECQQQI